MTDQTKTDPKLTRNGPPAKPTEDNTSGTATISFGLDKPEMALMNGGIFALTIPLNAKGIDRIIVYGTIVEALFRLKRIFDHADMAKAKIQRADSSVLGTLKKTASGLFTS